MRVVGVERIGKEINWFTFISSFQFFLCVSFRKSECVCVYVSAENDKSQVHMGI